MGIGAGAGRGRRGPLQLHRRLVIVVPSCWLVSVIWGIPLRTLELPGAVATLIAVIVVVARPDCDPVGQIFSAAFIAAGLGLILFTVELTSNDANGGFELLVSGFFVLISIVAVTLWISYVNATSDVLCRFRHSRPLPEADPWYQPFVSLHIAVYNEPPDMLIETIRRAEAIDYPNFEIVVIDNNTKDPAVWRPSRSIAAIGRASPSCTLIRGPGSRRVLSTWPCVITAIRAPRSSG